MSFCTQICLWCKLYQAAAHHSHLRSTSHTYLNHTQLHFWLCIKDRFENANCGTSDSDDDAVTQHHCITLTLINQLRVNSSINQMRVAFHQCPTCFELFSQREIESHAYACAEAWVDPIGHPNQIAETPSEEEPACYNLTDATSTLGESAEANLKLISSLRSLRQCELTDCQ